MITPTVERHFAAIRITTSTSAYHLNRDRLVAAVGILNNPHHSSAARELSDAYPALSPREVYDYLGAAQVCIDYNIEP